jgi:purine-binding chemotaxis protein CheW
MAGEPDEALLRRRAARYAARGAPEAAEMAEHLCFRRGSGEYALPLVCLREVRPLRHVARVPGASPVVVGVFQFRGELLSAHDLAGWLGPGARARGEWMLVVEHGGSRLGLVADAVEGIERREAGLLGTVPVMLGERGACFRGMLGGQRLLIEPERLFSTPSFFQAF